MNGTVVACVVEGNVLSCTSSSRERFGQRLYKRGLECGPLKTEFLDRSFLPGILTCNELDGRVFDSGGRYYRSPILLAGVWMMGGGPRTYPGGSTKWQWKKRQSKEDWKLGKSRLTRERKLFHTRRRHERKDASPGISSSVDGWDRPSYLGELVGGFCHAIPLDPAGLSRQEGVNKSVEVGGETMSATEGCANSGPGRQVSTALQERWTGSRKEVAEQILKVKNLVSNQDKLFTGPKDDETMSSSSFAQLPLSPLSLKALHFILGIPNMTLAQEATLPIILEGKDVLARTKGGSEDIISTLLQAIEVVLRRHVQQLPMTGIARMNENMTVSIRHPVKILLVCPTRERASFVAAEAKVLLMFHTGIRLQVIMGGNNMREEIWRLRRLPCEIVVATPGRLFAHLQKSPEVCGQLGHVRLFVLDQAQKLLEIGYRKSIQGIARLICQTKQTLLWSTSQSDEVLAVSKSLLKKGHCVINTCGDDEDKVGYSMVRQEFLVVPMEKHLAAIYSLLKVHAEQDPNCKVMVFCQTVRTTTFMAEVYRLLGFSTRELHMRKSEKYRDRVASEFRTCKGGLFLFTCGASSWGVTNPDITLILQIGSPLGREQYIQRITLSGQEIKNRNCILLLMPHQRAFIKELSDIAISESSNPDLNAYAEARVQQAVQEVNILLRMKAYVAWLRYHLSKPTSLSKKDKVIQLASVYSTVLGFETPPHLNIRTLKDLGLDGDSQTSSHMDSPQHLDSPKFDIIGSYRKHRKK